MVRQVRFLFRKEYSSHCKCNHFEFLQMLAFVQRIGKYKDIVEGKSRFLELLFRFWLWIVDMQVNNSALKRKKSLSIYNFTCSHSILSLLIFTQFFLIDFIFCYLWLLQYKNEACWVATWWAWTSGLPATVSTSNALWSRDLLIRNNIKRSAMNNIKVNSVSIL